MCATDILLIFYFNYLEKKIFIENFAIFFECKPEISFIEVQ